MTNAHMARGAYLRLAAASAVSLAAFASPALPAGPTGPRSVAVSTMSDIYTVRLAGGRVAKITNAGDGAFFDGPTWSSDGRSLAFSGSPCDDCPDQDARLFVARLATGRISRISLPVSPAIRPSWRAGGDVLAFVGGLDGAIYRVRADGTGLMRLVSGPQHDSVAWSPDGGRIAYTEQRTDGSWDIVVDDLTRHRTRALVHALAAEEQPAWSPDGRSIAFTRQGRNGRWSLYVVDGTGSRLRRVGPRWSVSSENPSWSPDGSQIAFTAVTSTGAALYVMDADGTHVRRLVTRTPRSYAPAWSPDGLTLAFVGER